MTRTDSARAGARLLLVLVALAAGLMAGHAHIGGGGTPALLGWLAEALTTRNAHPSAGQGIFVMAIFLAGMVGVMPLSLLAAAGGALYGLSAGFVLSAVAIMASSLSAFLLSRYAFGASMRRWLSRHVVLSRIDEELGRRGWRFVLLLRLSPVVPFSLASYAFGLTAVTLRSFLVGTVGALPALFAFVLTGALSGQAIAGLLRGQPLPGPLTLGLLAASLVFTLASLVAIARIAKRAAGQGLMSHEAEAAASTASPAPQNLPEPGPAPGGLHRHHGPRKT